VRLSLRIPKMDERSHWDFAGITRPVAGEFGEVMLLGCNSSCGGDPTVNIYAVPNVTTSSSGFLLSLVTVGPAEGSQ